jgi:tetratricopeptide (TPR) repeat protein
VENCGVLGAVIALVLLAVIVVAFVRYQLGLARVTEAMVDAEEALDAGEVERARALMAPLLERFPKLAVVQEVSADVLYAAGDPLSAASLWEQAMKKLGAARVAPRLTAAYTALNRPGDARRAAGLVPDDALARVTLAWCELAAIGGDREKGRALADEIARDDVLRATPSGDAMASALCAIAQGHAGERSAMQESIAAARRRMDELAAHDRAFVGYLVGVAQREGGAAEDARATWTSAMEIAPGSIGAALARRERSHLPSA